MPFDPNILTTFAGEAAHLIEHASVFGNSLIAHAGQLAQTVCGEGLEAYTTNQDWAWGLYRVLSYYLNHGAVDPIHLGGVRDIVQAANSWVTEPSLPNGSVVCMPQELKTVLDAVRSNGLPTSVCDPLTAACGDLPTLPQLPSTLSGWTAPVADLIPSSETAATAATTLLAENSVRAIENGTNSSGFPWGILAGITGVGAAIWLGIQGVRNRLHRN